MNKMIKVWDVAFYNKKNRNDAMGWTQKVEPTDESIAEDRELHNLPVDKYEVTITEKEVDKREWNAKDDDE